MKKEAYEESTIRRAAKNLKHLQRYCTLADPEIIKTYVANKKCSNSYKENLIEAYAIYMRSINQTWNQPFHQRYDKPIKIPTEEKIDLLISNARQRMSLFLSMSKDLGTRPIELTWLRISDIDLQKGTAGITGAKHTLSGIGKLRPQTLDMLKAYITKKNLNLNDRLFPTTSDNICELYRKMRNALATKLQDPTIRQIRLYDFRHFKASMEYHKTNSIVHVKETLRHKDIRTTMRYIHLFESMIGDEFHSAVAHNSQEAQNLIENGFDYVATVPDTDLMLFRKRK